MNLYACMLESLCASACVCAYFFICKYVILCVSFGVLVSLCLSGCMFIAVFRYPCVCVCGTEVKEVKSAEEQNMYVFYAPA